MSGNGLNGTINGTPAGSSAAGIDLGGTADISLAHSTLFETDSAPTTVDQDSWSEVGVCITAAVNTLADNTAIISKCDDPAAFALGWWAEAMADGKLRVHFVSHALNDVVIETQAGTIVQGTPFSLFIALGLDGVWAALNGRMLRHGYKNILHIYGDDHRVRDIVATGRNQGGSRKVNKSSLRVGKIGSAGARGDITVKDVALIYRDSPAGMLTLANAQAVAGASGDPLPTPAWGTEVRTVANGATAATVQTALDGGAGTVRLAAAAATRGPPAS